MSDKEIVLLFLQREESALAEIEKLYKNYCISVAERILNSREDSEECWNDVLSGAWNSIPPNEPENLRLYLAKIARNSALKKIENQKAKKRDCGICLQLDELAECIPAGFYEQEADIIALRDFMNGFIKNLSAEKRQIFIRRYWLCEPVKDIAKRLGYSENKVSLILLRIRKRLKKELKKEGLDL